MEERREAVPGGAERDGSRRESLRRPGPDDELGDSVGYGTNCLRVARLVRDDPCVRGEWSASPALRRAFHVAPLPEVTGRIRPIPRRGIPRAAWRRQPTEPKYLTAKLAKAGQRAQREPDSEVSDSEQEQNIPVPLRRGHSGTREISRFFFCAPTVKPLVPASFAVKLHFSGSVKVSQGHETPRNFTSRGLSRSFSNGSPGRARIPRHAGLTAAW